MSESSPLAPGALAWLTDVLDQIEREAKDAYAEARDMNAADAANRLMGKANGLTYAWKLIDDAMRRVLLDAARAQSQPMQLGDYGVRRLTGRDAELSRLYRKAQEDSVTVRYDEEAECEVREWDSVLARRLFADAVIAAADASRVAGGKEQAQDEAWPRVLRDDGTVRLEQTQPPNSYLVVRRNADNSEVVSTPMVNTEPKDEIIRLLVGALAKMRREAAVAPTGAPATPGTCGTCQWWTENKNHAGHGLKDGRCFKGVRVGNPTRQSVDGGLYTYAAFGCLLHEPAPVASVRGEDAGTSPEGGR